MIIFHLPFHFTPSPICPFKSSQLPMQLIWFLILFCINFRNIPNRAQIYQSAFMKIQDVCIKVKVMMHYILSFWYRTSSNYIKTTELQIESYSSQHHTAYKDHDLIKDIHTLVSWICQALLYVRDHFIFMLHLVPSFQAKGRGNKKEKGKKRIHVDAKIAK